MSRSWIAMSLKMPPPPLTYLARVRLGLRLRVRVGLEVRVRLEVRLRVSRP